MQKTKAKMPAFRKLTTRETLIAAGIAVLIALIAILCISINMRAHIQDEYASVRNKIGESLYSNMYMMMQTFDMTSVPSADVQNAIIPQMEDYFVASTTLNDVLSNAYGQKYTVLTADHTTALKNAFSAYEKAFAEGSSTDLAYADMLNCMEMVRELLACRFSEGVLKPMR